MDMEETVEKNIEGFAEKIILEDELKRAEELVQSTISHSSIIH